MPLFISGCYAAAGALEMGQNVNEDCTAHGFHPANAAVHELIVWVPESPAGFHVA